LTYFFVCLFLTLDYVNIDDEKTRAIVTSLQQTTVVGV